MEDKRNFPRIKTDLKVNVKKNTLADIVDLSEGGLSFNTGEDISTPTIALQVDFPDGLKIKANARLVWHREIEEKCSLYGVEFIELDESSKSRLRKELIKTQIDELLKEIKSSEVKEQTLQFFLKDILSYIKEITGIAEEFSYQKKYSSDLQKKFDDLTTQILLKGYCLEELFEDKKITQRIKDNFRQLVGTWIYKSAIVKRAYEKPRGYPGDYKMLEIVYDNEPISKDFGIYPDNCFLKSPYAVAVRMRKNRLREILLSFINESRSNKIHILDIACGSCREIKELLSNLKTQSIVTFNCLDWDEEALRFSQDVLLSIKPKNVEFKFIKEDIMNLIKNDKSSESIGEQDLIYSIGLIDYLPDRVLKKLIYVLYQLLKKEGRLILTHKNREKTFPPLPPDWFCDWKFVSRNKDEVIKLFYTCGISEFSLSSESDDFEYIYYFTIIKK